MESRRLHFPLLADFEPKGGAAKAYGAYRDQDGVCERALFVIVLFINFPPPAYRPPYPYSWIVMVLVKLKATVKGEHGKIFLPCSGTSFFTL